MSCGWFPSLFEDELFYSGIARYFQKMGIPDTLKNYTICFGGDKSHRNSAFAVNLDLFIDSLPKYYTLTAEDIINNHTLYPLYATFMTTERQIIFRNQMHNSTQSVQSLTIERNLDIKFNQSFRYCSICVNEDRQKYGETYWHRIHNIPGITVCAAHKINLVESSESYKLWGFITAEKALTDLPMVSPIENVADDFLWNIALDAQWLLTNCTNTYNLEQIKKTYRLVLTDLGYRKKDIINEKSPWEQIIEHRFGKIENEETRNFLRQLFPKNIKRFGFVLSQRDKTVFPISHLVLSRLLGFSIKEFFNYQNRLNLLTKESWPCKNLVCPHHNENVILDFEKKFRLAKTEHIGIFKCDYCGYTYRCIPGETIPARIRVVEYGELWNSELKRLWADDEISIHYASKLLGVTYKTLAKQAAQLGLPPRKPKFVIEKRQMSEKISEKITVARVNAKLYLKNHPDFDSRNIPKELKRTLKFLHNFDEDWFYEYLPKHLTSKFRDKINWDERELEWIDKLPDVVEQIKFLENYPRRITRCAIAQTYGFTYANLHNGNKLQKFCNCIENVVETTIQFQSRMIDWAYQNMIDNKELITKSRLIQVARISQRALTNPLIQEIINSYLSLSVSSVLA